jgi:transcriptional repressor NrdR
LHVETRVLDKREAEGEVTNRRRRECLNEACGKRFTTYERVEAPDLVVIKKDGRRETFSPLKLRKGLVEACHKRPVSMEQVDQTVAEIEAELRFGSESEEVASAQVGEKVMAHLKALDKVAYIRFASVYREFADVSEFEKALRELKREEKEIAIVKSQ